MHVCFKIHMDNWLLSNYTKLKLLLPNLCRCPFFNLIYEL